MMVSSDREWDRSIGKITMPLATTDLGSKQSLQEETGAKLTRNLIFISYSHKDQRWLDELLKYLKPIQQDLIKTWSDTEIRAGADWKQETEQALSLARVAVLLVTPEYVASDQIILHLPTLLDAAEQEGLAILWVAVRHCLWKTSPFAKYHPLNDPYKPLGEFGMTRRDREWVHICEQIRAQASLPSRSNLLEVQSASPAQLQSLPKRSAHKPEETQGVAQHRRQSLSKATPPFTQKKIVSADIEGGSLMNRGAIVALKADNDQKTQLLAGYVFVEEDGKELILVRGDSRLPVVSWFTPGEEVLESAISTALCDLFDSLGISMEEVLATGFSPAFSYPLYKVDRQHQSIEPLSCVLFKFGLNKTVQGRTNTWREKQYRWEPKSKAVKMWNTGNFTYAEQDEDEARLPWRDDPYKAILEDRISMELGFKVLECVDMLIFRQNERGKSEFLLIRRRDNGKWEYPKGGLYYHEMPLEGALREIYEETGIASESLRPCGSLGWQTPDVRERERFYDILRVRGLTFYYPGNSQAIELDGSHDAYDWYTSEQASDVVWVSYGPEFFRRWQQRQQEILRAAGLSDVRDSDCSILSSTIRRERS